MSDVLNTPTGPPKGIFLLMTTCPKDFRGFTSCSEADGILFFEVGPSTYSLPKNLGSLWQR